MEQSTLLINKDQLLNNQHYSSIQISYGTINITTNTDQLWNNQHYSSIKISYGTIQIVYRQSIKVDKMVPKCLNIGKRSKSK